MTTILVTIITFYRRINTALVSLRFPLVSYSGCRSVPTCSEYAIESIRTHGPMVGIVRALRRIGQCNPLSSYVH